MPAELMGAKSGLFTISLDRLSERGTTRSLRTSIYTGEVPNSETVQIYSVRNFANKIKLN